MLIAGPITGHPKEAHEYEKSVILLKQLLETSPSLSGRVNVETHFHGWPTDPTTLDTADTIVLVSDGGDHQETDHPLYVGNRREVFARQMARGCGAVFLLARRASEGDFRPETLRCLTKTGKGHVFVCQTHWRRAERKDALASASG